MTLADELGVATRLSITLHFFLNWHGLLMTLRFGLSAVLLLVFAVLPISGCGMNEDGRREISGSVKLKGQPLNEGVIEFHPLSTANGATKSGSVISNGEFTIPPESGLVPGKYKVLITAGDGRTPADSDELPGPTGNFVSKDRIPPEYNVNSNQEVEVKLEGPNVFQYDIP